MWRKDVDWMQLAQNWVQLRLFVNMIVENLYFFTVHVNDIHI